MSRNKMQSWLNATSAPKQPPPSLYARDLLLATDPKTPGHVLESLVDRRGDRTSAEYVAIRLQVAQNPNTPRNVLANLSHDVPSAVRNPALILIALEDPRWCQENLPAGVVKQLFATVEQRKADEEWERQYWEDADNRETTGVDHVHYCPEHKGDWLCRGRLCVVDESFSMPRGEPRACPNARPDFGKEDDDGIPF